MKYVIVGNGIAGVCAAEALRQLDTEGHITLVGDETVLPYSRPMISMVLEGAIPPEKLSIRGRRFYENFDIEPLLGNRISGIDVSQGLVVIENQPPVAFDRLLIATGADARSIEADGENLENIFHMRTEKHVRQIIEVLPTVRNALVLGGGLVGFKAACGLLKRGLKPTMLITSDHPLSMQVDEAAGKMILDELLDHGLTVKTGVSVRAFEGERKVKIAYLSDGTTLPCDLAITGKGVLPALAFVPRDKIAVDQGIVVDGHMETDARGIFAAGDVAQCMDVARKTSRINAIWPEAAMQGRVAGYNMAGRPVAYEGGVSRNVMRIFGLDLMTLGLVNPKTDAAYETFISTNPRKSTYRKLVFREKTLVGAVLVNDIEQGGLLLSLIRNETPLAISGKKLLEPGFNFRKLMR